MPRDGSGSLVESSMRALLIALGPDREACSRIRLFQQMPWLRARGIDVHVESFYPAATDGVASPWPPPVPALATTAYQLRRTVALVRHARTADVVVLQRVLLPGPLLGLLRRHARRLLFDLDDAIDLRADGTPDRIATRRLRRTLRAADAVLVASPHLAARLAPYASALRIIPSPVDTDRYRPRTSRPSDAPPVVGWIGSGSTTPYLAPVLPVLRRLVGERLCRVRLIGARLPGDATIDVEPWSLDREVDALSDIDIGIMPLSDDAWARGKAGYKLLQYMALGLPSIASPVGVNAEIVEHGRTGHLVTTPDEWDAALRAQLADAAWRAEAGRVARARIERDYALTRWAPALCDEIAPSTSSVAVAG